jgi:hypothetical protein
MFYGVQPEGVCFVWDLQPWMSVKPQEHSQSIRKKVVYVSSVIVEPVTGRNIY